MVEIPTQMGTATQLGETLVWPSVNLKVISEDIIDPMLLREGIRFRSIPVGGFDPRDRGRKAGFKGTSLNSG